MSEAITCELETLLCKAAVLEHGLEGGFVSSLALLPTHDIEVSQLGISWRTQMT